MSRGLHNWMVPAVAALALALGAGPLLAQDQGGQEAPPPPPMERPGGPMMQGRGRGPGGMRHHGQMRALFLRVASLPADQQAAALEKDEFFQQLPARMQEHFRRRLSEFNSRSPEERQQWLDRLQRFSQLPPEEQERLRRRAERFRHMSPEEREEAHRLFDAWRALPPERRQLLRDHMHQLMDTAPEQRQALLADPKFLAPMSDAERKLFTQVWQMRQKMGPRRGPPPEGPPPGAPPPGPPPEED